MGKDREGSFHPKKGKPSSSEGVSVIKDVQSDKLDANSHIAEKYTEGEEEPAPNVRVMHPNRNVDKNEERKSEKRNNQNKKGDDTPTTSNKSKELTFVVRDELSAPEAEEIVQVNAEIFKRLAGVQADICISIYLPTHSKGAAVNEQSDQIEFKNQLQQITAELKESHSQTIIEQLLRPAYELLRDDEFWLNQEQGLVVFLTTEKSWYARLPLETKAMVVINTSFVLQPLVPLFTKPEYYYVLVLSKKQVKFYRGDYFTMKFIPIPELPNGVDNVVHFEEKDDEKLFRTETAGAGEGANYHGMGAGKPDEKKHLAMYFDEVDETLWKEILNTENAPLILAGVEYLIPIYKSVAEYKYIWPEAITGSHEHDNIDGLHQLTLEKLKPHFSARTTKALEQFGNNSAGPLAITDAREIIAAAHYGRVAHLFIANNFNVWGKFDEMENQFTIHDTKHPGDDALADKAVTRTLLNGGEVHILEQEAMPNQAMMAALMRYPENQ